MLNFNKEFVRYAVSVAFICVNVSGQAFAEDDAKAGRAQLEEIVVTGTKRSVAQQDLSVAVTTVTSQQLENTFQNDVTALTQLAPNVNLTPQTGFNAIAGGMRGTGFNSILVTKDASVGITVDEFAFNHVQSQFVELFDMEQVEIYRGPQGTLFGKNTTGGAIAFTTKKPELGEFFGDVEANYSQFASNDSKATKLKASVNVPLGETLAARLAVIQDKSDGFYTNDKPAGGEFQSFGCPFPGQPGSAECNDLARSPFPDVGRGEDIGGKDVLAAKLKFRWQPNDFYLADLIFEYVRDRGDTVAAANETPLASQNGGETYLWPLAGFPGIGNGDPFSTGQSYTATRVVDIPGGHKIDADGVYLNQTFQFDQYTVKWILGTRSQDEVLASTYTGEAYTSQYDASRNSQREQLQNELRLSSNYDGPFNFVTGASYYEDDVDFLVFGNLGYFLIFAGPAAVFGAGGAARAVIASLLDAGVPEIFLTNRTRPKADALRSEFGTRITVIDWVRAGNIVEDSATLINTTSLGLHDGDPLPVDVDRLDPATVVSEIIMKPEETALLRIAGAKGHAVHYGRPMLDEQIKLIGAFIGCPVPDS